MMRREYRRDIVIGLLITVGLLLMGEIAVRTYVRFVPPRTLLDDWEVPDPVLGWKPRPGFKKSGIEINSLGFRGREFPVQKAVGTFRIVALGDSTTFGHRETQESSYPVQLEMALNQRAGACGLRYEVINGGVEGYSARHVLARLEREVVPLAPDLLIAYVGWNDLFGVDPEHRLPTTDPNSWFNRLLRKSYLLKATTKLIFEKILPAREKVTPERTNRYRQFVPAAFLDDYRHIVQIARGHGVRIAVTTLPSLLGSEEWQTSRGILHYPAFTGRPELLHILWERYNDAIRTLVWEMDLPLLEVAEGVRRIHNGRTLFIDTLHFNTPGYRALAQIMARGLAAGRLLPCAPVTRAQETS